MNLQAQTLIISVWAFLFGITRVCQKIGSQIQDNVAHYNSNIVPSFPFRVFYHPKTLAYLPRRSPKDEGGSRERLRAWDPLFYF